MLTLIHSIKFDRTYYKRGILYHIDGTKLIYKFNTSDSEVQHYMNLFHQRSYEGTSIDGVLSANILSHLAEFKSGLNRKISLAMDKNGQTGVNDQVSFKFISGRLNKKHDFLRPIEM